MTKPRGALSQVPGDLMMWVLIVSELLVFGAGLVAFLSVRVSDAGGFATARGLLHADMAGLNTMLLATSGFLAALAVRRTGEGESRAARLLLAGAGLLGAGFLGVKVIEFADLAARGIDTDTSAFFTFYFLLTGFHAAHVGFGIVILGLVAWKLDLRNAETGSAFWHMVDMVWMLLFPVLYLLA